MYWWGKIAGGILGWMLLGSFGLGPVGFIAGLIIGHQFDRGLEQGPGRGARFDTRQIQDVFFATTFSVMGHVAKADGRVSEDEIRAARAVMYQLHLAPEQIKEAIRLFTDGKRLDFPLRATIDKFRLVCCSRHDLCRAFIEIQMQSALATAGIHPNARRMLWDICRQLGISRVELAQIEALIRAQYAFHGREQQRQTRDAVADAYKVLGVTREATDKEVKTAYRRLMNQHHPDKLVARGLPESMMQTAKEKTREIRAAYDAIKKARNMR